MSSRWGDDDLMKIANATREPAPPAQAWAQHPSKREVISDADLEAVIADWAGDQPVPYIPTNHHACAGCGITLCDCDDACDRMEGDACGHRSAPLCAGCGPESCRECRLEEKGSDR